FADVALGENEFVVEKIIRRRVSNGRVEYHSINRRIDLCYPEDNLDCPELIEAFLQNSQKPFFLSQFWRG
uniref:Uncharacterized protein n=1 Tax=Periophthalmus magnuspinnatus TaxID=409849 RepID=A0A3B4ABJ2_9GOBI